MSDAVWFALIVLATQVVKEYFDRQRSLDAASKVAAVANKAEAVRTDLAKATESQDRKLDDLAEVANTTHKIVNQQRTDMEATIKALQGTISQLQIREAVTQERAAGGK
jgi:cell division FtsZ-interacting protein ZapD